MDLVCQNFVNQAQNIATYKFWKNLHGKRDWWEGPHDQDTNGLDTVDMFFAGTHGIGTPYLGDATDLSGCPHMDFPTDTNVRWSMWDVDKWARGSKMGLGNEPSPGPGLSVFVTYACDTAKWDGKTWGRWYHVFDGLRMALGHAGNLYMCGDNCPDQAYHGAAFVNYLANQYPIMWAWLLAYDNASNDGRTFLPSVISVGTDRPDCLDRLSMTWQNFKDYSRLPRESVEYMCGAWWEVD